MSGPGAAPGWAPGAPPARHPPRRPSLAREPSPWRTAFAALAIAGIAAGAAWLLLGSRLLVVRSVVVTGTHLVPAAEVRAAADIPPGLPMADVNADAVAGRVEGIRQVASAQVSRSWPDRVVIAVHERTAVLAVPVPAGEAPRGGYDLVDASGVIVRWARAVPRGLPGYRAGAAPAALRGSPEVAAAATVLRQVPRQVAAAIRTVSAPSPQDVTLYLNGGVTVVWGGTGQPGIKARALAVLLRTHARYYDVSAPGSVATR